MAGRKKKRRVSKSRTGVKGADALNEILDTDKLLKQIKWHLGLESKKVEDEDGNKSVEWEIRDNALLNQQGIESVTGFIRMLVDKNQALSIYNEQQIRKIMEDLHRTVARDLIENWEKYDVNDRATLDKVVNGVTNNCLSIFNRAIDGETLIRVTESAEQKAVVDSEEDNSRFGL